MSFTITQEAKARLIADKDAFINVLGTMRGTNIYEAGFTIAVHSRVFDMIYNNNVNKLYLSELIMKHDSPIVNIISGDYVLKGYTDFSELESFVDTKLHEIYHDHH